MDNDNISKTFTNGQEYDSKPKPNGRTCSNPKCCKSGDVQPWSCFYRKGNRFTSRCKVCLSVDRANTYKIKKRILKAKKRTISKVIDAELKSEINSTEYTPEESTVLNRLLQDFIAEVILKEPHEVMELEL